MGAFEEEVDAVREEIVDGAGFGEDVDEEGALVVVDLWVEVERANLGDKEF